MPENKLTKEQAYWIAQYFGLLSQEGWTPHEVEKALLNYVNHNKGDIVKHKENEEKLGFTYESQQ